MLQVHSIEHLYMQPYFKNTQNARENCGNGINLYANNLMIVVGIHCTTSTCITYTRLHRCFLCLETEFGVDLNRLI